MCCFRVWRKVCHVCCSTEDRPLSRATVAEQRYFFLHVTSVKNRLRSRLNLANDVCLDAKVVETELLSS